MAQVQYSGKVALNVVGIASMSVAELSYKLTAMRKEHHIDVRGLAVGDSASKLRIIDRLENARPGKTNLMVETPAVLALTTVKVLTLEEALRHKEVRLHTAYHLDVMDYVSLVCAPSDLSKILTLSYKISPYQLRKESVSAILKYANSELKLKTLKAVLSKAPSQAPVLSMLTAVDAYRSAVVLAKMSSVEEAAKVSGLEKFDINYLMSAKR